MKKPQTKKNTPTKKKTTLPNKDIVFYYEQKQIVALTLFYALLTILIYVVASTSLRSSICQNLTFCVFTFLTMILSLFALSSAIFVMIFPQPLAIINKEGIKIDHNELLKWDDIAVAKERNTSKISKRKIISLIVKDGVNHKLTFMQKLCKNNIFTPFSIPLYAMTKEDRQKITDIIKAHTKYEIE